MWLFIRGGGLDRWLLIEPGGRGVGGGGLLPSSRLMGMCCWMGSYFHDWVDYYGVVFLEELLEC